MEFSEKLQRHLAERGLSQADAATTLGTNQQQISRWVQGNQPPSKAPMLLALARMLGVTVDYLIDPDQEKPPAPPKADLPYEDRVVLDVVKALGIDYREAVRRLYGPAKEFDPSFVEPHPKARLIDNSRSSAG